MFDVHISTNASVVILQLWFLIAQNHGSPVTSSLHLDTTGGTKYFRMTVEARREEKSAAGQRLCLVAYFAC